MAATRPGRSAWARRCADGLADRRAARTRGPRSACTVRHGPAAREPLRALPPDRRDVEAPFAGRDPRRLAGAPARACLPRARPRPDRRAAHQPGGVARVGRRPTCRACAGHRSRPGGGAGLGGRPAAGAGAGVRAPLSFVYGNLVFGSSMQDAWALFVCPSHSYAGLSVQAKHEQLGRMAGALQAIGADVQLLRIGASWDAERYLTQQREIATPHREALDAYLDDQGDAIAQVGGARPWCAIAVRLAEPQRDLAAVAEHLSERPPRQWWRALREAAQWNQRGLLRVSELERLRVAADQAHARLDGLLE